MPDPGAAGLNCLRELSQVSPEAWGEQPHCPAVMVTIGFTHGLLTACQQPENRLGHPMWSFGGQQCPEEPVSKLDLLLIWLRWTLPSAGLGRCG